jgi:hypothetical protein
VVDEFMEMSGGFRERKRGGGFSYKIKRRKKTDLLSLYLKKMSGFPPLKS